jgi:hypothetical protein
LVLYDLFYLELAIVDQLVHDWITW